MLLLRGGGVRGSCGHDQLPTARGPINARARKHDNLSALVGVPFEEDIPLTSH
jgi:hypothetical protein